MLGYDCFCTEAAVTLGCTIHDMAVAEQAVTLLGGPRAGELEMVKLKTNRIEVSHTPDMKRPAEVITGVYIRAPKPNSVFGSCFVWVGDK